MLSRRTLFKAGIAWGTLAVMKAKVGFARAALPDDRRFIVVILRGGLDGLAAVPAHGDADYETARGQLSLPKTGAGAPIDLDGFFGLHPSLHNLSEMWREKELAVFHGVSTPYRDRSHFDAQNVLETGGVSPHRMNDGWLNRALLPLGLDKGNGALSVSSSPPLLLDGSARVTSWMPPVLPAVDEDFLARVTRLYASDKLLSVALQQALATQATAAAQSHDVGFNAFLAGMDKSRGQNPNDERAAAGYGAVAPLMKGAGNILAQSEAPRVAVFDISGWDTHFNQGAGEGQLARRLQALDDGFAALKDALGPAWRKTVIVTASEFGRTVAVNGTGGTDHGTASIAFMLGGAVAGGHIHASWKGLKSSALRDGRDLQAGVDTRSLFKAALADHLGVSKNALEKTVFPDSSASPALKGFIRA